MGIIRKQAIAGSVFAYLGIAVGFVNAIILAPRALTSTQIGLTSILVAYSLPFVQLSSLGFSGVISRIFPYFRDGKSDHHGFLALALAVTMIGFMLSIVIFLVLKPWIVRDNIDQSPLFVEYLFYLIPLIFFSLVFNLLDTYNRVLYDAVLGTFLKDFLFKVVYALVLLSYLFHLLTFPQFVFAFIAVQSLPAAVIAGILIYRKQFSLKFELKYVSRRMRKLMVSISFFAILSGLSGIAISTIDRLMINSMINLSATGIYTVSFYFSVLLMVPMRSIRNISTPVIAEQMKIKDFAAMKLVYFESSLNQLLIGFLIFIGIWANVHNIFELLPKEYEQGKWVILFMMMAKLFEMTTGIGNIIIAVSRYYRYQTWFMLFLIVLVGLTNLLLIPRYGITGAAIASALSSFVYNLVRIIFIWARFKMQPFRWNFLKMFLVAAATYLLSLFIPTIHNYIWDILIRSCFILFFYGVSVFLLKISATVNQLLGQSVAVLKERTGKHND